MGEKWADYLISEVHYIHAGDRRYIGRVKVHEDDGNSVGRPSVWNKADVIDNMERGKAFCTVLKGESDKWRRGRQVMRINLHDITFLKTEVNDCEEDNLGNLSEF